jgi:hypothetical protein
MAVGRNQKRPFSFEGGRLSSGVFSDGLTEFTPELSGKAHHPNDPASLGKSKGIRASLGSRAVVGNRFIAIPFFPSEAILHLTKIKSSGKRFFVRPIVFGLV